MSIRVPSFLLFSLLMGVLVFAVCYSIGDHFIEKYYMSENAVVDRRLDIYGEFRKYILEKQVNSTDRDKIGAWTKERGNVTLIVRSDHNRIEAGNWGANFSQAPPPGENTFPELTGEGVYYMRFNDGIHQISISENSEQRQYFLTTIISVIAAAVTILLTMYAYMQRISSRVIALSNEARELGRGNLEKEIITSGNDEISRLGNEMNDMRISLINRMESENRAWQANSSLITAISHDLRNPMTAMIGYLELLQNSSYSEEQKAKFIDTAHSKALEIKDMTDELFKYFLVFGNEDIHMELENYDAEILIDQLTGENIIRMREDGYDIRQIKFRGHCSIRVDVLSMKRIFDNLFSNLKKYADKDKLIIIRSEIEDEKYLSVFFSNHVGQNISRVESNKIGLRTCERLALQLGSSFKTYSEENMFTAELILPICFDE